MRRITSRKYDYDEIRRLHDAGMRHTDIRERLGCSWATITHAIHDPEFDASREARPDGRHYDRAEIVRLGLQGVDDGVIAQTIGCSRNHVYRTLSGDYNRRGHYGNRTDAELSTALRKHRERIIDAQDKIECIEREMKRRSRLHG